MSDLCAACDGTGERNTWSGERCSWCGGTGLDSDFFDDYGPEEVEFWETFYEGVDVPDQTRGKAVSPKGTADQTQIETHEVTQ